MPKKTKTKKPALKKRVAKRPTRKKHAAREPQPVTDPFPQITFRIDGIAILPPSNTK